MGKKGERKYEVQGKKEKGIDFLLFLAHYKITTLQHFILEPR